MAGVSPGGGSSAVYHVSLYSCTGSNQAPSCSTTPIATHDVKESFIFNSNSTSFTDLKSGSMYKYVISTTFAGAIPEWIGASGAVPGELEGTFWR